MKWLYTRLPRINSVAFLCTDEIWLTEQEIRETTPFTTATNNAKLSCGNSKQASERPVRQESQVFEEGNWGIYWKISLVYVSVGLT